MLNKRDNPAGFPTLSQILLGKSQDERFSIYEDHYYTLNQYKSNYSLRELQELKKLKKENKKLRESLELYKGIVIDNDEWIL